MVNSNNYLHGLDLYVHHAPLHLSRYSADNLGLLQLNMMIDFTTTFPTMHLVSHQWNYSLRQEPIIMTFSKFMYGGVQSMSLIQSYRMDKKFLSVDYVQANCWDLGMYILLLWPMSATFPLIHINTESFGL